MALGSVLLTPSIFYHIFWIAVKMTRMIRRGLGNDNYTQKLSDYFNYQYCVVSFRDSVEQTENDK